MANDEIFSVERATGRCECRGQCGGHAHARCLTFHGQRNIFGEDEDKLYQVKRVRGEPKNEHQVRYVCEKCRATWDPWRAQNAKRVDAAAVSDHDVFLRSLYKDPPPG